MLGVSVREVPFDDSGVQGLLAEWNDELGFVPKGGSTVEASDFTSPGGVFLVAVAGETPVGCGGLRRLTGTTGEVKRVFVRQAARGRGVGRTLLGGLERRARERGFRELRLDTDGDGRPRLRCFAPLATSPSPTTTATGTRGTGSRSAW